MALIAKCHSSGFVVCSYNNESLLRMLEIELISDLYGLIHIDDGIHHSHSIVSVALPVYFTAFAHYKERLPVTEYLKAVLHHSGKSYQGIGLLGVIRSVSAMFLYRI